MVKVLKSLLSTMLVLSMLLNLVVYGAEVESEELIASLNWTSDFEQGEWKNGEAAFSVSDFEPGSEIVRYFKIGNEGKRALSYKLSFVSDTQVGALADVIDVYCKGEVSSNVSVADMTKIGTLADVINGAAVSEGNILPEGLNDDGFYSETTVVAVALKMRSDASADYMNQTVADFSVTLTASECAYDNYPSVDKFAVVFPNTESYIYRVGNANAVNLGSLFKAIDGADIGNVTITIETIDPLANAAGVYTPAKEWIDGTIQFSGTGPVKVTIADDDFAKALSLNLEVVNAKNITKAESATANDVVLLNDISGTFVVSGGHTFFGNGFTVTLPTTSVQNIGNGFTGYISVGNSTDNGGGSGGNLDNVRIEGPVYPEMYIYRDQAQITDKNDSAYGDGYNMRYFKNSVIIYGGDCTISNSYISGSRTPLCMRGGNNVVVENTTLSGGSYANMQICAGSSVILRDLTTVQTDVADSYGKGKNAHGLGIAVDSNVVDLYIEGELKQYNWLCQEQWNNIVPSVYQSTFPKFFTSSSFQPYWHYLNGGDAPYVNIAFVFACNWDTSKIHDNRETVDYDTCDATIAGVSGGVYSKVNTVGGNKIEDSDLTAPDYVSPGFNPVAPVLNFDNTANHDEDDAKDANDTYCVYNESNGILKIGMSGSSKPIDLSGVTVTKNGSPISFAKYLNGTEISGDSVEIKANDGAKQYLTFKTTTNDSGYDEAGNPIDGNIEYTWTVTVEVATLTFPAPVWNMGGTYKFDTSNCVYAYYKTSQGYGEAVPIYEGVKVNYHNKNGELVQLDLRGTTTLPTGSNNSNANAFTYTLADGSTLTMKFNSGWKSGATTHQFTTYENKVYIYPQSLDNDNYVRAGVKKQNFDVKIAYTFTDPNGQSTDTVIMNWYNAMADNGKVATAQWKAFDSIHGKEDNCFAEGTLITLADGSQKAIEELTFEDELLVWDFFEGKYTTSVPSLLLNDGVDDYDVITLNFDDDSQNRIIYEHGFFDVAENDYVLINADNVESFVGHTFIKNNGLTNETVTLEGYEITKENIGCYTILTAQHNNCIANGLLTVTPPPIDGWYDYFEIGEGMKYDEAAMEADIAKYGLYTYDDFKDYISYEEFVAFNGEYLKILVGKGYFTFEDILEQITVFGVGSSASAVAALSLEDGSTLITVISGNSISTTNYDAMVSGNGIEATEDGYLVKAAECDVILTADGTATTGYAKISVGDDVYYTNQIAKGESFTLTMKNAVGKAVSVESFWGNSANYGIAQDTLIESGKVIEYTYTVEITATSATETEDGYLVGDNESVFNLKAVGTATMGYAVIAVDGDAYYTQKIVPDEEFRVTVKNGKGKTVEITSFCGEFDYGTVSEEYILGNDDIIDCGTFVVKSVEGTAVVLANTTKYASETVDIYVAVYDSQNRMVAVKSESNVSVAGKDEHTFDSKLTIPENGYAKVFVWSGNGAFKPFFSAR